MSATQQKKAESTAEQVSGMDATPRASWACSDSSATGRSRRRTCNPPATLRTAVRARRLAASTSAPSAYIWILAEGEGEMPGGTTGRTLMTLGYHHPVPAALCARHPDFGSMMTHHWVYDASSTPPGTC